MDRMKSAKSCSDSRGTRASLACGAAADRPFGGIETDEFEIDDAYFPVTGRSVGGWEPRLVCFVIDAVLLIEEDRDRSASLVSSGFWNLLESLGLPLCCDELDCFPC